MTTWITCRPQTVSNNSDSTVKSIMVWNVELMQTIRNNFWNLVQLLWLAPQSSLQPVFNVLYSVSPVPVKVWNWIHDNNLRAKASVSSHQPSRKHLCFLAYVKPFDLWNPNSVQNIQTFKLTFRILFKFKLYNSICGLSCFFCVQYISKILLYYVPANENTHVQI